MNTKQVACLYDSSEAVSTMMRELSIEACLLLMAAVTVTDARPDCICPENSCIQNDIDLG